MLAKLHWQRKNSFQEGMHDPKWIQCHLKKEKKTNLHFCSSNIIKRTRIVTRLALNLQGWVHGLCSTPREHGCPRMPVACRRSRGTARVHRLPRSLAFLPVKLMRASFCCLSSAIIWACWIHLASKLHGVFGPRHTWVFVFSILPNPCAAFKQ